MKPDGMPRKRKNLRDVPHPRAAQRSVLNAGDLRRSKQDDLRNRVRGTAGPWPVSDGAQVDGPKAPVFCMFNEVLDLDADEPAPIFGQYPRGFIGRVLPWLRVRRAEVLHVCSGSLAHREGTRVDVRQEARPDLRADGRHLPLRDGSAAAVMLDPPYTADYAETLYGTDYPLPSHLLREAARVVRPCGRIAFVHFTVPYPPAGTHFVKVLAFSTGCGYALRAVTIFEREQASLFSEAAP